MIVRSFALVVLTFASIASAAPEKQLAPNTNLGDPNEKICETIKPIGSRLATKRICATRAEWAERKAEDKQALERAQAGACMRKAGCP
jgi:hypothetical protein